LVSISLMRNELIVNSGRPFSIVASILGFALLIVAHALADNAASRAPQAKGPQEVGLQVPFLRLERHDNTPALCDAAIYGSLAATSDGALCVC
jgi:hypothetical protein